jgi:SAM-dependent methyltransferase
VPRAQLTESLKKQVEKTMKPIQGVLIASLFVGVAAAGAPTPVAAQATAAPPAAAQGTYEPKVGQAGKDVVWVPSPEVTVEKMLDVAKLTPQDFVVDLGSGDGRNIIAAAKRGARGLGVEFNADMVELSKRNAQKAGVGDRAQFVQGDMYAAEFSQATVLALFLLPENLNKLKAKFADLRPGTRIVANTFGIEGWTPEESLTIEGDCTSWCTVLLYYVPAKVDGSWQSAKGELALKQEFQTVSGTLGGAPIESVKLKGDHISFTARGAEYSGRVNGNTITGVIKAGGAEAPWTATRAAR